ncbi:MAG: hypothetical protein UT18_C0022G0004 [candidate division CPR2 bacterium GW2011_GWC2_39_10]|uniref:Uncharacterized protein n=1 Tax=candidate division CPR2 bacterium GW2011_GWC2_39_10 TaxID=1618345 RepID=A0A0G0LZ77_UNCC2|nr:MAG: hypothetical protein UT18_C0022G0004 [candidate division CPR2 bacterium GW2011_GWC2_39_10]
MKFIDVNFEVPIALKTESFTLRPLSSEYAEMDYKAIMSSLERLQGTFGPSIKWPSAELTLGENQSDLELHHDLFIKKEEFSYIILDPKERYSKGCIYLVPLLHPDYDVLIYSWVTAEEAKKNFHPILIETIKEWLQTSWPFKKPVFPGVTISWDEWDKELEANGNNPTSKTQN